MNDAAHLMDRIYATQRHFYDATRKFYLLGRDGLIRDLMPPSGGRVLEIGCGTARNLIVVARHYPDAACYGIDVSQAMLETAARSIARAGLGARVAIALADATSFDPAVQFGVDRFDRIVISYALSMIPPWTDVLRHASSLLAPDGSLHVVDFGDQAGLPALFKRLLETWLAWFHVTPRENLSQEIARLAASTGLTAHTRSCYRGYALRSDIVSSSSL